MTSSSFLHHYCRQSRDAGAHRLARSSGRNSMDSFCVTRSPISMSPPVRSDAFSGRVSISIQRTGNNRVAVAMGVVKYKGTQMREQKLTEMIEKKVKEAKEVCDGDERSAECKVAWDEVEEISQAKADLRLKLEKQDPLESFCQENPDTDECRLHED